MITYTHSHFYPSLGEKFKYKEFGKTNVLKCILQTDKHPCFFSSPTGGCARCSLPITCNCLNVNGHKVQFTHVNLLTEKDDMFKIEIRYYSVGKGWEEWHDIVPYKIYDSIKEVQLKHNQLMRNAGDCTDYRIVKVDIEF